MAATEIRAQVEAEFVPETLKNALDANLDGVEDAGLFEQLVSNAETLCRSRLGSVADKLPSSLSAAPSSYQEAVLASVCVSLARRARGDKDALSVWTDRQTAALGVLDDIAAGKRVLMPGKAARLVVAEPLEFGRRGGVV